MWRVIYSILNTHLHHKCTQIKKVCLFNPYLLVYRCISSNDFSKCLEVTTNSPSSWRRYWFPPRSLAKDQASPSSLSQNSTTLFLSSCTQVPSEFTTWYTNNAFYSYSQCIIPSHSDPLQYSPSYSTCKNQAQISASEGSMTCKHLVSSQRTNTWNRFHLKIPLDKMVVKLIIKKNTQKKTYSKIEAFYWKVNAWSCVFSTPWNNIGVETHTQMEILV